MNAGGLKGGAGPNGFWLLRLLAAGLVVFGHSFVITGQVPPRLLGVEVQLVGVHVFFVISGYLITGSWQEDPCWVRYAWRRALRIMPGLVAVVVLTALVLGPGVTALRLGTYFAAPGTWLYLWNAGLAPVFSLPGVFGDGRPYSAVNGSLWSLPIEVALYALVPLVGGRGVLARRVLLPAAALAGVAAAFVFTVLRPEQVQPVVWWNSVPFGLRYAGDFALGALARSWALERWLGWRAGVGVLALVGAMATVLGAGPGGGAGAWLGSLGLQFGLPFVVLSFGLAPAPCGFAPRTDVSYGVYLWSCPLQQVVVGVTGIGIGAWELTALALLLAGGAGLVSWHAVERPFLQLKPRRRREVGVNAVLA